MIKEFLCVNNNGMLYAIIIVLFIILLVLILLQKRPKGREDMLSDMNEKDIDDNIKRLAISLRSGEVVGNIPNIEKYLKKIKKAYKTVVQKVSEKIQLYECERWLYENFYSVTLDIKQSDYKSFARLTHKKNNVRIIELARFVVASSNCNTDKEVIKRAVKGFNGYTPLHYDEILNLKKAFDYALIERMAKVCERIVLLDKLKNHAQNDVEPVKRLCKYDEYLYYFKHSGKLLDEKYFYKINDINPDNIELSFSNQLVDNSVIISNCVKSLKELGDIFSDKFVIKLCAVYDILQEDEIYRNMDLCSQYAYINAIETLSRLYGASERSVAKTALELAKIYNVHFGEIIYDYRYAIKGYLHSFTPKVLKKPTTKVDQRLYASVVALLSLAFTTLSTLVFLPNAFLMIFSGIITFFASVPLSRFIISIIIDHILPSRNVARMNFASIPEEGRTLCVVSEYICDKEQAIQACKKIIALSASDKDKMIEYSLLVDLKSSDKEVSENDEEIIDAFETLREYSNINVFVRKRTYNGKKWVAYERKRGAINALNRALTNNDFSSFFYVQKLQKTPEFVVLLDDDNILMSGALSQAVNTMLHPLNKKYSLMTFDAKYRMSSLSTIWSKQYMENSGVDSYCFYGDFYYKISAHSIYCGKGIYRLKDYYSALDNTLPENRVLSHDIIEGAILSTGSLAIPTYEDAPKNFASHIMRENRWQRGDILLMPYVFSKKVQQPFYKYVISYNILKTILPVLNFVLLIALLWTKNLMLLLPFGITFIGVYLIRYGLCLNSLNKDKRMRYVLKALSKEIACTIYDFIMLPFFALSSVWLWLKTIFKAVFARKNLLDWKTFYSSQKAGTFKNHIAIIFPSVFVMVLIAIAFFDIAVLVYAGIFVLFANALYFTYKSTQKSIELSESDKKLLKSIAEKTSRYFESNLQENCLICDNYQAFPNKQANNFTSPTNIGFALLSHIAEYKIGRKSIEECVADLEKSIELIESLEKYHGHLYNWYSLATHEALPPYFVSSVDSGNFLACLVVAKQFVKDYDLKLYSRIRDMLDEVDFDKLFDSEKGKFFIGYNRQNNKFEGHYDMLASEARILCYVASCLRSDTKYWEGLAKNIVNIKGNTLVSWSGTAFEYLMPQIFMSDCEGSLLTKSIKNAVKIMINTKCNKLWGISESGYYEFNEDNHYKYKAFGIGTLSLRSADDRCVISPYSTMLALKYAPKESMENIRSLIDKKMLSSMGMYEALDMTKGEDIVASLMSHHQGMTLCSIINVLYDDYFVRLFMSDESMQSGKLLLETKMPEYKTKNAQKSDFVYEEAKENCYQYGGECKGFPIVNVMSNGHFSSVTDSFGNGYCFSKGKYLNRFLGDPYKNQGGFFYIKDDKELYSPTFAPFRRDRCTFSFRPYESVFENLDKNCKMTVYIPQNSNCEIRKITIYNKENYTKKYMCGFCEDIALADFGGAFAHPAFADMFVSTSYCLSLDSLIARRQSRQFLGDCYSSLTVLGADKIRYESNIRNFIGRERGFENPIIFDNQEAKSVSIGDVLNACLGFVGEVEIAPYSSKDIYCIKFFDTDINSLKSSLSECKKQDFVKYAYESARLTLLSKTYKYQINDKISDLICRIGTNVLYKKYDRQQLVEIANNYQDVLPMGLDKNTKYIYFVYYNQDDMLKNIVYTTIYLNMASVKFNLVIAYELKTGDSQSMLKSFVDITGVGDILKLQQIKFLETNGVEQSTLDLIKLNAFIVIDEKPKKGEKITSELNIVLPKLDDIKNSVQNNILYGYCNAEIERECGEGGFDKNGDYIIKKSPLLPYSNVICGEYGGFVITTNGGGFDYFENSNLSRASIWENNPIYDNPCEEIYLFDKSLIRINRLVKGGFVKHSAGKTTFRGNINGIEYELTESIISKGKAKAININLSKSSKSQREIIFRLNAMLGDLPRLDMLFDEQIDSHTIKITNALNNKIVYIRTNKPSDLLWDKSNLYGIYNDIRLSETKSNHYEPSHAIRIKVGDKKVSELSILISNSYDFISKIDMTRINDYIEETLCEFKELNKFELCSKDKNLNLLFNKWLPYQVVSSRINGKCGYYQAGGAIGFRDQLQDNLTMLYMDSKRVRNHILLCAEHQYLEGDVQHWWHPQRFGVRTQISDDKLFLPLLAFEYVEHTGDKSLLEERVKYLISSPLNPQEESRLEVPQISKMGESVFNHIKRAIDSTLKYGQNGLLLIGGGDWNDAINEIGMREKGESIWLSMFCVYVLRKFLKYVDFEQRREYLTHIERLQKALDKAFKDGYFMRATTDDGELLGTQNCPHFMYDILCQSWSVIANISSKQNQRSALKKVSSLIDNEYNIIKLLYPPQTKQHYYGYISSYPEGVRENGGQYTHASVWYVKALAMLDEKIVKDGVELDCNDLLNMLNPISRGQKSNLVSSYMGEPYVLAGDIYTNKDNYGRMGWSWYTGSASILYDTIIKDFLCISIIENCIVFSKPKLRDWEGTKLVYRYKGTIYNILFSKGRENLIKLDGICFKGDMSLKLQEDKGKSEIIVSFR